MTTSATLLGEAELHGLVDGHLEVDRRADVLRKLAASPVDRALVEAWQAQNDLIRAAFRDVEHESLPVALDLAPPRLRCIDGGGDGSAGPSIAPIGAPPLRAPVREPPAARRGRALATVAAVLVVAAGLAGSWLLIDQGREDEASPPSQASLETTLSDRTAAALRVWALPTVAATSLPAIRIPDLSAAGLKLVSVSTQGGEPATMVLHYRDASDARVVLGVVGAPDATATPTTMTVGKTLVWRRAGIAYALAGTPPADRLRILARSLQDEE